MKVSVNTFHTCRFFQAEDGIRDRTVTGVQTCALPISYIFLIFSSSGPYFSERAPNDFFLNFQNKELTSSIRPIFFAISFSEYGCLISRLFFSEISIRDSTDLPLWYVSMQGYVTLHNKSAARMTLPLSLVGSFLVSWSPIISATSI